jgi:high-affinity iron transporter
MGALYASSFVFILLVTAQFIYAKNNSALSPATAVTFTNGHITIPTAKLGEGELQRYVAKVDNKDIRFFLYRKPDNKVAALFDACEVCGPVGFYTNSGGLVCKNCVAPINSQSVGQAGGCNPVPLRAEVTSDSVIISEADLAAGAGRFQQ